MFCAGNDQDTPVEEYQTVCRRDSGSQMVFPSHPSLESRWSVEGIVSHFLSKEECSARQPGQYSVFTRVNRKSHHPLLAEPDLSGDFLDWVAYQDRHCRPRETDIVDLGRPTLSTSGDRHCRPRETDIDNRKKETNKRNARGGIASCLPPAFLPTSLKPQQRMMSSWLSRVHCARSTVPVHCAGFRGAKIRSSFCDGRQKRISVARMRSHLWESKCSVGLNIFRHRRVRFEIFGSHCSRWLFLAMVALTSAVYFVIASRERFPSVPTSNIVQGRSTPLVLPREGWQRVWGLPYRMHVFSAFYQVEGRAEGKAEGRAEVKVVGLVKNPETPELECLFAFEDGTSGQVKADIRLKIDPPRAFTTCFVTCPVDHKVKKIPRWVSIIKPNSPIGNSLEVWRNSLEKPQQSMGLCVRPLLNGFDDYEIFLEFLEFYGLMGVSEFRFYVYSVGRRMNCLLQSYQKEGIATVVQWNMPYEESETFSGAQVAASNDCVYSFRGVHKYGIIVDVDEFLVPRVHESLWDLMEDETKIHPEAGAMLFHNTFFYRMQNDSSNAASDDPLVLRKTTRTKAILGGINRAKYIFVPERILVSDIHHIHEFVQNFSLVEVDHEVGLLHHYRGPCVDENCLSLPSVNDESILRFREAYLPRFREAKEKWFHPCLI
ncbi:unnamed protein product [Darwinula stevensoni]|uniref:Glycosyltransferase family 92 protein n=1 Tax=Darwinula stevensoni TaxID=69355 RepID=A0A7R8XKK0_9CRUS|nr:unnamed protein product [Darwinula stevensoni]CAG0895837.1 unnamed protein product [Darwinula stevensoni]